MNPYLKAHIEYEALLVRNSVKEKFTLLHVII